MNLSQPTFTGLIQASATVRITASMPGMFMSNSFLTITGKAAVKMGGTATVANHAVKLVRTMSGGVKMSGHAAAFYGGHMYYSPSGGMKTSGAATLSYARGWISTGGYKTSGTADQSTFTPAIYCVLAAEVPNLTAAFQVVDNTYVRLAADLPALRASFSGGTYALAATLPTPRVAMTALAGTDGALATTLPAVTADFSAQVGAVGTLNAAIPAATASFGGAVGYICTLAPTLPLLTSTLSGGVGTAGQLSARLPALLAQLDAGFGAIGFVSATLPHITAALSVLAQATAQELVMVVATETNALSSYTDFPFTSFCEIDGVYYGAGPNGFSQIDTTDLDGAAPISAGVATGLMNFGEPHKKRITDAYLTLRAAGAMTFAISVDEGTPVILPMDARGYVELLQRRVATPKGLQGKSWKFELNNVDGADFDFAQLGFNVAVSARRIRG